MEGHIPRTKVPAAKRNSTVRGDVSDRSLESGDVVLRLLHTADWPLGRRFPSFPEEAQKKLSRARMEVVGRILDVAQRHRVDAVLCAGDVFDEPSPSQDFWEGLLRVFQGRDNDQAPVFLLPG